MAKKDSNGAAHCKDDTEDRETESGHAQTEEDDLETRVAQPSCKLTAHTVEETAL